MFFQQANSAEGAEILEPEGLTNQILHKEIELLRLNTRFRLETTERSRYKPWRVFAYNLAAAGASQAGITTISAERWRTWRRPATASRDALKAGPIFLLIGHSITLAGILTEATIDGIKDYKQKKKGFDAKTTKRRAIELQLEIDNLIEQRNKSLSLNTTTEETALETDILKDLRDIAVSDFAQSYIRSRKQKATRNFSYVNGASAASTGGYLGSLCGLLAITDRDPTLAGPAGIGFIISGANIATGTIFGKIVGNVESRRAIREISRDLVASNAQAGKNLDVHLARLKEIQASKSVGIGRFTVYERLDQFTDEQAEMNIKERKKADADFKERLLFNAAIGGTKMGWGIQLANAGFSFQSSPPSTNIKVPQAAGDSTIKFSPPKARGANELFAHRVAQGATTYIPGTSLWILDTLQARLRGEKQLYVMGSQDALPHQKLNQRLLRLEELDKLLPSGEREQH